MPPAPPTVSIDWRAVLPNGIAHAFRRDRPRTAAPCGVANQDPRFDYGSGRTRCAMCVAALGVRPE